MRLPGATRKKDVPGITFRRSSATEGWAWLHAAERRGREMFPRWLRLHGIADRQPAHGQSCVLQSSRLRRGRHRSFPERTKPEAALSFRVDVKAPRLGAGFLTARTHPPRFRPASRGKLMR